MLVSVIVPFYKGNKYIFDLCSSIEKNVNYLKEKQSDCLIECIIVNDSPDVNVILPDGDFNFKIQVVYHEKNAGIQQARVTGLKYAKGDFIVFLDQDDELLDYAIFEEINNIDNADVLICNALIENEKHETHKLYSTNGMLKNALTLNAYIFGHNRIVSPGHCMIKKTSIPIEWKKNNKFLYRQPCYGWRYFMLLLYIAHDISLVSLHAVSFEVVGCCSNLCN